MRSMNSPPVDLEKYLVGRKHVFVSYEQGARMYSMPYWTFVNLAKEAKATKTLRKTAIVDIDKFETHLEENYSVETEKYKMSDKERREVTRMPKARKTIENIEELIGDKKKKYVRYAEGAALFSMGLHTFENLAKRRMKLDMKQHYDLLREIMHLLLLHIQTENIFIIM